MQENRVDIIRIAFGHHLLKGKKCIQVLVRHRHCIHQEGQGDIKDLCNLDHFFVRNPLKPIFNL